jgi:hypothetical protein
VARACGGAARHAGLPCAFFLRRRRMETERSVFPLPPPRAAPRRRR